MGQNYDPILELRRLPFINPDAGLPGVPSVKGHPKLHVVVGEPIPELTTKLRSSIPPSKYLLHVHAPGDSAEALRASRPKGERTLFLEITPDDRMLGKLSGLLKTLRPDHADLTVQTSSNPIIAEAIPKIRMALDLEMPNLEVDRKSALTRLRCSLLNLGAIARSPRLSAKILDPSLPALVCGAGPSLAGQLDFIKENAKRLLIVACGHAAIKMKEAGFEPDFVVEADPRCRINWSRLKEDISSPLAALACADPAVCSRFKRVIWLEGDSPEFNSLCEILGFKLPRHAISRGVIVTALDLAFKLGCQKAALAGCDLALSSEGASHAGSNRAEGDDLSLIQVDGQQPGSKVTTTLDFNDIRKALETHLEQAKRQSSVFNCTPSGARIEGIEHMPLKSFIEAICVSTPTIKYEMMEEGVDSILDMLKAISAHIAKHGASSRNASDCARKVARELANSQIDQARFQRARTAYDMAMKEFNATLQANGMSRILSLLTHKAEDTFNEAPGSNVTDKDAFGQLRNFARSAALTSSLCVELKGDIDFACAVLAGDAPAQRDPADFKSLRELNAALIAKSNPELADAIASKTIPSPESAGFSLHLRFEDIPQISKLLPDGSKIQFSGLLSGPAEASRIVSEFAKGFDPSRHAAVIVAPGNYAIVERFAKSFPDCPCLLIDPWPELLGELAERCLFLHRLPEGSPVIVAHESMKSWRKLLSKALSDFSKLKKEPLLLLNPKTSSLPEVRAILELKELS